MVGLLKIAAGRCWGDWRANMADAHDQTRACDLRSQIEARDFPDFKLRRCFRPRRANWHHRDAGDYHTFARVRTPARRGAQVHDMRSLQASSRDLLGMYNGRPLTACWWKNHRAYREIFAPYAQPLRDEFCVWQRPNERARKISETIDLSRKSCAMRWTRRDVGQTEAHHQWTRKSDACMSGGYAATATCLTRADSSNAVKYSPPETVVRIGLKRLTSIMAFSVDQVTGRIAPEDDGQIFTRVHPLKGRGSA